MSDEEFEFTVEATDRTGDIGFSAPDHQAELNAGGTAAVVAADIVRRWYDDPDLAAMFDTAGRFINDVTKTDMMRQAAQDDEDMPMPQPARGQIADLFLLEMACLWAEADDGGLENGTEAAKLFRAAREEVQGVERPSPWEFGGDNKGTHRYYEHRER